MKIIMGKTYTDEDAKTKMVYVETLFWRYSDPLFTVAGFNRAAVIEQARKLAEDELETAVDQDICGAENPTDVNEDSVRDNLESDLCSTGCSEYSYVDAVRDILDAEYVHELDQEGITIL